MATVGRPRSFDKEDALTKAMHVFWEKGYEGTTMADLIKSIGMKAPSIYAAFGNKDAIFKEVVQQYLPIVVNGQLKALNSSPEIYKAVENCLTECINLFSSSSNPHTCLIITSAINTSPEHSEHSKYLKKLRSEYNAAWTERFKKAHADKQLTSDTNPTELAEYFTTVVQGMALKGKDGASKAALTKTAELALKTLTCFTTKS